MYTINFQEESLMPREKLLSQGAEKLSNQELLAILIRTGTKTQPVSVLSQKLLQTIKYLANLKDYSVEELQNLPGIGRVKAIEIKAMIEFGKRVYQSEQMQQERVIGSESLAVKMIGEIGHEKQEHLVALYLNTQNRIIQQKTIFIGSVDRSIAVPREILHYGVKCMASSIVVVHNHPSGLVEPSQHDIQFTHNLKESCDVLGLVLLDHLIVGQSDYFSFREETEIL